MVVLVGLAASSPPPSRILRSSQQMDSREVLRRRVGIGLAGENVPLNLVGSAAWKGGKRSLQAQCCVEYGHAGDISVFVKTGGRKPLLMSGAPLHSIDVLVLTTGVLVENPRVQFRSAPVS